MVQEQERVDLLELVRGHGALCQQVADVVAQGGVQAADGLVGHGRFLLVRSA
ncbi:hypothetical protein [Klebsiella pneumoniae]|uniref:hypothetical protein n=1 Tax=Klebsiella pneumoniae TaxID=573 RepID=UPI00200DE1A3|nr:hypothetical protein [Klebsiella pneumoniae]UPY99788.1 hypothetical protein MOV22_26550 [Klebsiella pneumoniae]